ncbi:MAG: hypothetical protein JXR16_11235 [Bermanella sp.]
MFYKFLILLLLPMTTVAMDLDLSYESSSESFHQASYQANIVHGTIMLAQASEARIKKERRQKREQLAMPVVVNKAKSENSVIPAILGCGLLGLSLYGDSSAWKAGSAMACGFGLTYKFN